MQSLVFWTVPVVSVLYFSQTHIYVCWILRTVQTQHFLLSIDLKLVCKLFGVEINSAFFVDAAGEITEISITQINNSQDVQGKCAFWTFRVPEWHTVTVSLYLFAWKAMTVLERRFFFLEERLYQVLYSKEYVSSVGLRKQIQVSLKVKVWGCALIMLQKFTESTVSPPSLLWVQLHPFDNTVLSVQPHMEQVLPLPGGW